jgi:hypothetical protein
MTPNPDPQPDVFRCKSCMEFSHIPGKCYLCGGKKEKKT